LVTIALRTAERLGDAVQLQLHRIEWTQQPTCLTSGAADIGFVQLPLAVAGVSVVPLISEPRVGVFPVDHPLATRSILSMADIAREPIIDAVYNRNFWIADPRPDGSHPVVVGPPASTVEEMLALVVAGRGMAITSASLRESYPRPDLRFVRIVDLEPVIYGLGWRASERRPVVQGLIESLRTQGVDQRADHE
jgi:DNA-binding transcriptional LysR family regulator